MVTNFLLSILLTLGPEISIATNTLNPAIALDSNGAVVIWADSSTHATRLSSQSPEAAMQLDSGPYRDAGVASIGGESLAVWLRNDDLWGQRIGADGQPDGPPIYIAFTDSRHTQRFAVGASRNRYLVAWAISSRIVVSVIDANGQILAFAIPIINGEYGRNVEKIAVASTGDDFIVVWDASTSEPWSTPCQIGCPGEDRDVHSIVVRADGTPRGETEQVLGSGGEPDVATNGTDFLVAWSRFNGGISARAAGANGFPKDAAFTLT